MSSTNLTELLNGGAGGGQRAQGITIGAFFSALTLAIALFAGQLLIFLAINGQLKRIYRPKTFLVPARERAPAPPKGPWQWIFTLFKTTNAEFIQKCGLDAYFFLRYLRALLKIFIPIMFIILPVLLPLNAVGGRGPDFAQGPFRSSTYTNVTGLDVLAWGNVSPFHNHRYWAHLVLALVVIVWSCYVFFDELKGYIRLRQAYLTSPQHRLLASATTVLVTAIPSKWCTVEALEGLYDVFPGGIRNIWINRRFDELHEKVKYRDKVAMRLEKAETELIRKAKKAATKRSARDAKQKGDRKSKTQLSEILAAANQRGLDMAQTDGVSSGDPLQVMHTFDETRPRTSDQTPSASGTMSQSLDHTLSGQGEEDQRPLSQPSPITPTCNPPAVVNGKAEKVEDGVTVYQKAYNEQFDPNEGEPKWRQYLEEKDRETMRLPIFEWMFAIPLIGKKVDTIYYCRKELARMNLEIEQDQIQPEKYPPMNSAFVQFNHQVAAHMACQAVSHHTPKQMAPRVVEISPDDVIWDNMSNRWWESYFRTAIVLLVIGALTVGWAIPVTFTGLLSHVSTLENISWLSWIRHVPQSVLSIIQGVLPPALLSLLLLVLPLTLRILAKTQGNVTGMAVELSVQKFYFAFLFVQLFLVVSISSGITSIIPELASKPQSVPSLLATNLPKASNYFFSYMLLQALTTSGGALLQVWQLIQWFLLSPLLDGTARQKWKRQMKLPDMHWGTFFPVYTNLACIGLIYSVISPLILIFNIITFGLFWIVYRYNTLYVTKFKFDTGGLLFPTAINQLFTGLYVMELCLIGLFFLVRDVAIENGQAKSVGTPCKPQAIIMIVALLLTVIYQWLLNTAVSPLLRYLPITLEDEAVMRDEEFAKAQERRWALEDGGQQESQQSGEYEMQDMYGARRQGDPDTPVSASWANRARRVTHISFPRQQQHQNRKHSDLEAQTKNFATEDRIAEALFAGISDEIEDLTPENRDVLIKRAFRHAALRAARPAVWIPRDDLGISDDEIERTKAFSKYIWISNAGTGLNGKGKVQYQKSPPDFSEVDLIQL
ncbi:MAG: hypothetical protein Q9217_001460 [Psora testacea]